MANTKTNRTEIMSLKVEPEVKHEMQRKMKLGWNFSEEVNRWFRTNFMVRQELEKKEFELTKELKAIHDHLETLHKEQELESMLTISPLDQDRMQKAMKSFKKEVDQLYVFNMKSGLAFNKTNWRRLKAKYGC